MNRQDQFERVYAELTGREVEAIKALRFRITEGYASPKIADAYRVFCAALDLMFDVLAKQTLFNVEGMGRAAIAKGVAQ